MAADLQPDNARYVYVYAVALNSLGQSDLAIDYLSSIRSDFLDNFDIHWALATMLRDQGRNEEARGVAEEIANIYPGVESVRNLLNSLRSDTNGNR